MTRVLYSTRTIVLLVHTGTCVEIEVQTNKVSVKMSRRLLLCALALVLLRDCWGLDNGLALTPPSKLPGVNRAVKGFHESDGALAFLQWAGLCGSGSPAIRIVTMIRTTASGKL